MRYQIDLTLRRAEGALTRVIGTAERRGFQPVGMEGGLQPDGERWTLRLAVEGERSCDLLLSQLRKLHDCLAVEVLPCR